jgi:hypothetical protein
MTVGAAKAAETLKPMIAMKTIAIFLMRDMSDSSLVL